MPDLCVNCGQPLAYVGNTGALWTTWVHANTGLIWCNNLTGTVACLPAGGAE